MTTALLVLDRPRAGAADADPSRIELVRATLNGLWSEDPGSPAEIFVHVDPASARIVRREHGNRALLLECAPDFPWGEALNTLVDSIRHRFIVLLEAGVLSTPGWLRELGQVAGQDAMVVGPCLPLGAAEGMQAVALPCLSSRRELRRAATQLRFNEPRFEAIEELASPCIFVPRETLDRIGRFDGRYKSFEGVLRDFQRRVRSRGGRLLLARRALLGAPPGATTLRPRATTPARWPRLLGS